MKINCLSCGFTVVLNDAYDNYEGLVKCYACSAMLAIKTEEGNVKAVQFVKMVPLLPAVEKNGSAFLSQRFNIPLMVK